MKITVSKSMNNFKVLNTHPENACHKNAHFPGSPSALDTLHKQTLLIASPFPEVPSLRIALQALGQTGGEPTGRTQPESNQAVCFSIRPHPPSPR